MQHVHAVFDWVDYGGDRAESIEGLTRYHDWLASEAVTAGGIGPAEAERLWPRHIADSLTFLAALRETAGDNAGIVDVGSGVGLPGIPLAIALPRLAFTLLDRSERRCDLADRAIRVLRLDNVEVLQGDAERETLPHAVAVSRAFAAPAIFREIMLRMLPNGTTGIVAGSYGATEPPDSDAIEIIRVPNSMQIHDRTAIRGAVDSGTAWLAKVSLSR